MKKKKKLNFTTANGSKENAVYNKLMLHLRWIGHSITVTTEEGSRRNFKSFVLIKDIGDKKNVIDYSPCHKKRGKQPEKLQSNSYADSKRRLKRFNHFPIVRIHRADKMRQYASAKHHTLPPIICHKDYYYYIIIKWETYRD